MQIIELSEQKELLSKGIEFFWACWGNDKNFHFYRDCIEHSLDPGKPLPKFYLAVDSGNIIGSYALLVNDLISRQDLMPWLACLFVVEDKRGNGLAAKLLDHGLQQAALKGFDKLYLSTDLENFYERKGWEHFCDGYGTSGGLDKIYRKRTLTSHEDQGQ